MVKILIAYDGSDYSNQTLKDLKKAGLPEQAEALVLTVADAWANSLMATEFLMTEGIPSERLLNDAKEISLEGVTRVKNLFPEWRVRAEACLDSPAAGVAETIKTWRPDWVVMGSHGHSAAARLLFGSVPHHILTHHHANLRICRGRFEDERSAAPLRLVVGYDGSEASEIAFEALLERTWPKGSAVCIVTVVDTRMRTAFVYPSAPIRHWIRAEDRNPVAWIERMQDDLRVRAEAKGLIVYTKVIEGDPKRVLLKEAEQWGADSIFAGCRGLTGRERIVAGSVSTALAMHAPCSVEVVHRLWNEMTCCGQAYDEHRDCMTKNKEGVTR